MSKSFKGEERAQARAVQQRRNARHSKIESRHSSLESTPHARTVPTHPVDARPQPSQRWTLGWRA